ncbi:MAG TPA: hypothetical protein ENH32_07290 [Proteobacteria bacterium]|nr:hypothetical protein BMS3Abin14_01392 [bacterium BMS3Abin14]HDL53763.1 hypothetical protein [Pseudomonadota bacterium]
MNRVLVAIWLVLICAVPAGTALAGPIPGRVAGEITLNGENSLTGATVVAKTGTLILEKGCRITAMDGSGLTVQGRLYIRGTAHERVVIGPDGTGRWKGITFLAGSEGRLTGLDLSRAITGISVIAAEVEISHSTVTQCKKGMYLVREGSTAVDDVRFIGNGTGIAVELKSRGIINRSLFEKSDIGVAIASGGLPAITSNRFEKNKIGVQVSQRYPGGIQGNIFRGNGTGVRLYQNGPDTVVERNLFEDNSDAAILAVSFSSPRIINNMMSGGRFGVFANQFSSPIIKNNVLKGMKEAIHLNKKNVSEIRDNVISRSDVGIFLDFSSYPLLRNNFLDRNRIHIKLGRFQSSNWESSAGSREYVMRTAAKLGSRNPKLAEVPVKFPDGVDATGNSWSSATLDEMKAKGPNADISTLYDGYDLPEVTYEGFGEQKYRIDKIFYDPWLGGAGAGTGLSGWKGKKGELNVP